MGFFFLPEWVKSEWCGSPGDTTEGVGWWGVTATMLMPLYDPIRGTIQGLGAGYWRG